MHDMTQSEMLRDPMIRQILRADKISVAAFAALLDAAARRNMHTAGGALAAAKLPENRGIDAASFI
jgi:hypothetical protein